MRLARSVLVADVEGLAEETYLPQSLGGRWALRSGNTALPGSLFPRAVFLSSKAEKGC